jgi:hypothetical protein
LSVKCGIRDHCRVRSQPFRRMAKPPAERSRTPVRRPLSYRRARRRPHLRRLFRSAPGPRRPPAAVRLRRFVTPPAADGDQELLSQVHSREHARLLRLAEVYKASHHRPLRAPPRPADRHARVVCVTGSASPTTACWRCRPGTAIRSHDWKVAQPPSHSSVEYRGASTWSGSGPQWDPRATCHADSSALAARILSRLNSPTWSAASRTTACHTVSGEARSHSRPRGRRDNQ